MTVSWDEATGLAKVELLSKDPYARARALRQAGQKVMGYLCSYTPLEFFTALDIVPHRIMGSVREPVVRADAHLEPIACPYVRSCLDKALGGDFDFLDGVVFPHSCDNVQHLSGIWEYVLRPGFYYFLNVPHMVQDSSLEFFKAELETLRKRLAAFAGKPLTDEALAEAVRLHNESRSLLRQLYDLRRQAAPPVTGEEVLKTVLATMVLPVSDQIDLLTEVLAEVRGRLASEDQEDRPRLMLYGCEIDSPEFVRLIEDAGADVVMDDLCTGTRVFWEEVDETPDPVHGLAVRYLEKLHCPRTYRARAGTHEQDLENRFGYMRDYIETFGVQGAVLYVIRYCDTQEFDAPSVRDYLSGLGLPVLHIEDDYTLAGIESLRTRVQAFVEMIL